ncbi:MAG TPA: hypothetical protein VGA34_11880, partial [Alteraurantiacibacter sp.]
MRDLEQSAEAEFRAAGLYAAAADATLPLVDRVCAARSKVPEADPAWRALQALGRQPIWRELHELECWLLLSILRNSAGFLSHWGEPKKVGEDDELDPSFRDLINALKVASPNYQAGLEAAQRSVFRRHHLEQGHFASVAQTADLDRIIGFLIEPGPLDAWDVDEFLRYVAAQDAAAAPLIARRRIELAIEAIWRADGDATKRAGGWLYGELFAITRPAKATESMIRRAALAQGRDADKAWSDFTRLMSVFRLQDNEFLIESTPRPGLGRRLLDAIGARLWPGVGRTEPRCPESLYGDGIKNWWPLVNRKETLRRLAAVCTSNEPQDIKLVQNVARAKSGWPLYA